MLCVFGSGDKPAEAVRLLSIDCINKPDGPNICQQQIILGDATGEFTKTACSQQPVAVVGFLCQKLHSKSGDWHAQALLDWDVGLGGEVTGLHLENLPGVCGIDAIQPA